MTRQLGLPKNLDCRPLSLIREIAPDEQKFTLILFDLRDGGKPPTDDQIETINEIFETPGTRILLDENQLIVLIRPGVSRIETCISRVEALLECKTGVVNYPEDGSSFQTLTTKAFKASKTCHAENLRQAVDKAIDNNEFYMVYQPQINTSTGEFTGTEALIRWNSPDEDRIIMPLEFIPQSEEQGIINKICKWTLYEACRQHLNWKEKGKQIRIAVNISTAYLLSSSFLSDLDYLLVETGIIPRALEIEITENSLITPQNIGKVDYMIKSVRNRGIRVALDDFGMQYNSLDLFRVLDVDRIKIDKVFVQNIHTEKGEILVQATIAIAKALRIGCIAEGVETHRQAGLLEKMGCYDMQGFLFGKPSREYPEWKKV